MTSEMLTAPFCKGVSSLLDPAESQCKKRSTLCPVAMRDGDTLFQPCHDLERFLELDLITTKLNNLLPYLWLAGLPRPARPLHRQKLIGRTILITEDPNEHLVWHESRLFLKPLPPYLLSHDFWMANLCDYPCTSVQLAPNCSSHTSATATRSSSISAPSLIELHQSATGLLLSYAWLVCHQSDLSVAKSHGLLPAEITWTNWTTFIEDFLSHTNTETLDCVSERYKFGELRLTRLNKLYWCTDLSLNKFVCGYMSSSTWYTAFFSRNFAWLLAVFAYVTVVLSALQVGLASERLGESAAFQEASYGLVIMSMITVVGIVATVFLVWFVLFWYHLVFTWLYYKEISRKRADLGESLTKG